MDFDSIPDLYLGTPSWSAESWVGPFYPPGTQPADFLPFYATQFRTVEIDSTYYRIPSRKMVQGWRNRTPPGFTFAAKFLSAITHQNLLLDCEGETDEFLEVMELLGEKLGPLLLQFPYLNQEVMPSSDEFLARLARYLERPPRTHRYAVEVRNRNWLAQLDLLRKHGVALALVDQVWIPTITQLAEKFEVLTVDFTTYVRWTATQRRTSISRSMPSISYASDSLSLASVKRWHCLRMRSLKLLTAEGSMARGGKCSSPPSLGTEKHADVGRERDAE